MAIAIVLVLIVGGVAGFYLYNLGRPQTDNTNSTCHDPDSIWSHVYNPGRLEVVKPCITASGTVEDAREEADGDYHILVQADQAYANLTNDANATYQHGWLVVEIICALPATQQDAIAACQNYTNPFPIPSTGQHITVSGPYVLDNDHFRWAEIHPVYSMALS